MVVEVMPQRRGRQLYRISWPNATGDELDANLVPDCDISNPFDRLEHGMFDSYSEYSRSNTTFKIRNSNNSTISSLKASKTLFRAYQFKPLLKFLNSPSRRLLVADEVGLGKTIEAGHIMLEMKARRELSDVLIVCPMSLQNKWREELAEKFGLAFKIYEHADELIADMEERRVAVHAIINYEKIRQRARVEKEEKEKKRGSRRGLIDYLSEHPRRFSLVLCDEAHRLRNHNQTYSGAEKIMLRADAAVFLTATPVMLGTENLYNLLHLLEPSRYDNPQIFDYMLEQNRPFVEAITALNHGAELPSIAQRLDEAEIRGHFTSGDTELYTEATTIGERLAQDPIYQEIRERLHGTDSAATRARLQYLLSTMSAMNNVFSRTRKREVTTDSSQTERKPHLLRVRLSDTEREAYDKVIGEYVKGHSSCGELEQGAILGLIQRKRQVASSVLAYLSSDEDLEAGRDRFKGIDDAKFTQLRAIMREVFAHGGEKKIVVFALFRKTLRYLRIRLAAEGYEPLLIDGMVEDRAEVLQKFRDDSRSRILLSSEVGSEGLDMQFCDTMVNYDLPWNPMVVEQRIGRIDRFGQLSPVVNIYNLVVCDSIQETIYTRLLDRIGIFRGTIGDMEAILDAPLPGGGDETIKAAYNRLERELYITRLTPEEQRRKIDEIERAIENEREEIARLESGLTNTLTNDAYFKEEINRILRNRAYVTSAELCNYLRSAMRRNMPTCELRDVGGEVFEFIVPDSDSSALRNFLTAYQPAGIENEMSFRLLRRRIEGRSRLRLTFSQQQAYDNRSLLFLNIYHPIIRACLSFFESESDGSRNTFAFAMRAGEHTTQGDMYVMAVYQLTTRRRVQGVQKHSETLLPLVYDLEKRVLVTDSETASEVFSHSQTQGVEYNIKESLPEDGTIMDIRVELAQSISDISHQREEELRRLAESERQRSDRQTREYFQSRIANCENDVSNAEWELEYIIEDDTEAQRAAKARMASAKGLITRYTRELDEKLAIINADPGIAVTSEIVSLSLIRII